MFQPRHRLLVSALLIVGTAVLLPAPAIAATPVPYTDYNSTGSIGLCDKSGHSITSGKITDKPFVWTAVSSVPPPAGYEGAGRSATLYVFQPRPKTYPDVWGSDQMTSASRYSNPAVPMAQATKRDFSLGEIISHKPPMWNGIMQLRMLVGATGKPYHTGTYPTTDIKITGNTWTVVRGKSVRCNLGTATAREPVLVTQASPSATSSSSVSTGGASTGDGSSSSSDSASATAGSDSTTGSPSSDLNAGSAAQGSLTGSSSNVGLWAGIATLVVLVSGGTWWFWRRSRASGGHS